jgi:hypothetical protein
VQHQQYYTGNLQRSVGNLLPILLLLASAPLLAWALGRGGSPSPTAMPALDLELGVPIGAPLLSVATDHPPDVDGVVEGAWDAAEALPVSLHAGLHGRDPAGALVLRSLYDEERVYFLAQWDTETPGGDPEAWRNLLTVHWRLANPGQVTGETTGSSGLACTVACRSETIPPGLEDDLPAGGGWAGGSWVLEWSRPRISDSPFDQDLTDPDRGYRFFVKIFEGYLDRPDPVSDLHELRLGR